MQVKTLSVLLLCAALGCCVSMSRAEDQCRVCHKEIGDQLAVPVLEFEQGDIHASRDLTCAACHGGDPTSDDPEVAMSKAKGFLGVPTPSQIPTLCARCHSNPSFMRQYSVKLPTDQLEKYWTSKHGQALQQGDTKVATCTSCHGVHNVLPAKNPKSRVWAVNVPQTCNQCHGMKALMSQYNISHNIYEEFAAGVHGKALLDKKDTGAPACNDCHGNHGAAPPGVVSVAEVCRECHAQNAELFHNSPHRQVFEDLGEPACVFCHSNHNVPHATDELLGLDEKGSCSQCHAAEDESDRGALAALTIKTWVDSLRVQDSLAIALVTEAELRGIEVSEAQFALNDARQLLIKTRTMIHSFDPQQVIGSAQKGLDVVALARQMGEAGLKEFWQRKLTWIIISFFILLLALAIWLKLKSYERSKG